MKRAIDIYPSNAHQAFVIDADFFRSDDAISFPPLAVAVDIVAITASSGSLHVLLLKRVATPHRGMFALPGVLVQASEPLVDAAERAVATKIGVRADVRQFSAFGGVERDPRMRVISIGYCALVPWRRFETGLRDDQQLGRIDGDVVRSRSGRKLRLPFDHDQIVQGAVANLRADLDHSLWSFGLLEAEFTLRGLQEVHEAVRGRSLNKPAFRKRLLDSGKLERTGRWESGNQFRPAELYTVNRDWRDEQR